MLFEFNSAVAAALWAVPVSADCATRDGPSVNKSSSIGFAIVIAFFFLNDGSLHQIDWCLLERLHMLEALLVLQTDFVNHLGIHYRPSL